MRLRNVPGSAEALAECPLVIQEPDQNKGKWNKIFENNHPIHIEIGMGKGQFIQEMAIQNPNINYIGIEMYSSVLFRAIERHKSYSLDCQNLYYLCVNAEHLPEYFSENEIARIYLNFSDPWPKDRHAKRRLTSRQFLSRYDQILQSDGEICFKTDNRGLFDFSVEEIPEAGWKLRDVTYDLHHSEYAIGNIMTEYEVKFSNLGCPINRLVAYR